MPSTNFFRYALPLLLCAHSASAADFPYTAYVATDKAEVVAGPGHRFYATDRLSRATQVEIYREEPSGWLAIRPPDGSFSWIPADFVERLEDKDLGHVKQTTGAWVGTSVEHVAEHHQQVTLKAGELVQILAEKSATTTSGKDQTWLKIAPPAGEYRWIHLRDVARQKPEDPPPTPTPAPIAEEKTTRPAEPEAPPPTDPIRRFDRPVFDQRVEPAQYRPTTGTSNTKSASPDGFVPRKRRDSDTGSIPTTGSSTTRPNLDPADRFATATSRPAATAGPAASFSRGIGGDAVSRQLDEIELDLSLMIAKDRSQWDLKGLKRRTEALVDSGADPVARGRARLVLDKIKQFEDAFDARSSSTSSSAPAANNTPGKSSSPDPLADPRYDAQGWLKPVVSKKSDKPIAPYAVVDAEGQPVCFISPSPGLNLNRYLNKQVGLYGRRGYLEELKKPHVMAERVIELDNRLR